MKFIKPIVFLVIIHLYCNIFAQDKTVFNNHLEDTLNYWGDKILNGEEDFIKYNANEHFSEILLSVINLEKSFDYPFDSLKTAFHYTSPDKKFRLFNWMLPKNDGTYEYYCILQSYNKKLKKYETYQLKDKSSEITAPENAMLGPEKWFGVLYYKVIYTKHKGKKYYTLLAWDGNNNITRKKIIDVLTLNNAGKPTFGASIFKYDNKIYKRIVFEYKANSLFSLCYDKQYSKFRKKKKKVDNQYVKKGKNRKWMIIFDKLIPEEYNLKGFSQFYIPDKSITNGFYFKNGKWIQVNDIDARSDHKHFIQKSNFYQKNK